MNDLEIIRNRIYEIRGQRVMLDRDLAALYGVETRALNQAVKHNIERFPCAFTELGVAMLSSVLKSPLAIQTNINIMRAFVSFRKVVSLVSKEDLIDVKKEIVGYIDEILADQNDINEENRAQLDAISEALAQLQSNTPQPHRPILGFSKPSDKK